MVNSDSFYKTVRGAAGLLTAKHGLQPNSDFLAAEVSLLALIGVAFYIFFRSLSKRGAQTFLKNSGVRLKKVAKAIKEIERKGFHMCGLIVPLAYFLSTTVMGYTEKEYAPILYNSHSSDLGWRWNSATIPMHDTASLQLDAVHHTREGEDSSFEFLLFLSGLHDVDILFSASSCYHLDPMACFGDMSAALFGVSFGGAVP